MLDFNEEDELLANTAPFKNKERELKYNFKDTRRLESIMSFNPDPASIKTLKKVIPANGSNSTILPKNNSSNLFNNKNGFEGIFSNKKPIPDILTKSKLKANMIQINDLIQKKHKMDIGLQRSLEKEMRKEKDKADNNSILLNIEKTDNGVFLGRKTFLRKKI